MKAKGPVIRNRKKVSHVVESEISGLRNVFSSYAVISLLHFAHLKIIKLNETSNFFLLTFQVILRLKLTSKDGLIARMKFLQSEFDKKFL